MERGAMRIEYDGVDEHWIATSVVEFRMLYCSEDIFEQHEKAMSV